MLYLDFGDGRPCCGIVLDGHGVAIMVPPVVNYLLEWERDRILAWAAYKGWRVEEIED